jgi:hypothetical protein
VEPLNFTVVFSAVFAAVCAAVEAPVSEAATGTTRTATSIRNFNMILTLQCMLDGGQYYIDKIGGHYFMYKVVSILKKMVPFYIK